MNDKNFDLEKSIAKSFLTDRRRDRRWRNVRFLGWMIILVIYAILIFGPTKEELTSPRFKGGYVSLIRLNGIIMPGTSFSAQAVIPQLNKAFQDKESKGVVIVINSPGGSPVQASIIHDKIEQLKHEYNKKVVVLGQDAMASGGYMVATAGDKIYVHHDTLTGSIGVIMSGFGFTDAIQKLGITRRVFTAGDHKDRLDPFEPLNENDKQKFKQTLDEVHQHFIDYVKESRGNRLKGDPKALFSGDFWIGSTAVKLGLADGTANLWTVLKKEFGVKHYVDYSTRPSLIDLVLKGAATELHLNFAASQSSKLEAVMP